MHKTKWWWAIMFLRLGIQLVKSILYVKYMLSQGFKKKKKNLPLQYKLCHEIAMSQSSKEGQGKYINCATCSPEEV
jgi:hypothetical protein